MTKRRYLLLGLLGLGAAAVLWSAGKRRSDAVTGVDLVQDFHGGRMPADPWQLAGRGAADLVRPEEAGLRVTLPAGQKPGDAIGVSIGPVVRGDFDVSCGYEVINLEKPTAGWGVGFELFIMTDTPTQEAFALERMLRPNGDDVYLSSRNTTVNGKREYHTKHDPATGATGRLRLTRTGREITAWIAEEKGDYRELGRYDLGSEDLNMVRFAAHPGVAKNAVDVRIADVKVHYDPATVVAVAGAPPLPSAWGWLSRAEIIGLEITLALVVAGAVVRRMWRKRRGRTTNVPVVAAPVPPPVGRRSARALAIVFAAGLATIGTVYAAPGPKVEPLGDVFFHDFRGGAPTPETLPFYGNRDAEFIKAEPEGMRITLPETYIHPWGGVGYQKPTAISGDFEITATIELLYADRPPTGIGVGAALRVQKAAKPRAAVRDTTITQFLRAMSDPPTPEAATIFRVKRPDGGPALRWDHTRNTQDGQTTVDSDMKPAVDTVGRLRLKRVGTTLYYQWGRGPTGDDFEEINHLEFGGEDVVRVRLTALTGRQPCAVDVRLLDLRIRSGPATAVAKPRRWLPAAALLFGVGLLVSMSWWFGTPTPANHRPIANPPAGVTQKRWWWLALALIPLVVLGGWLLRSHHPKPVRSLLNVRLGNEYAADVEEEGFSYQETDRLKQSFRWTDGKAKLVIPLEKAHPPRAILVHLAAYRAAGVKTAHLQIVANGRSLFDDNINLGTWKKTLDLSGLDLGEQLTLELLSDSFVPAGKPRGDGKGASDDARALGVQVFGITLVGGATEETKP